MDASETILQRRDAGIDGPAVLVGPTPHAPVPAPPWLTQAPPREITYAPPIKPSTALGAADQLPLEPDGFDLSQRDRARRSAALAGQLAHTLLQHLPGITVAQRPAAAARFVATQGAALDPDRRTSLITGVLDVLRHPDLAMLFGPGSRAEVGIAGPVRLGDGRALEVTGQIDRISVTDDAVLIADFKTGRPHNLATVPAGYVTQLALYRRAVATLYPGKTVRAFLVWTAGPVLLELPADRLDGAMAEVGG